MKSALILFFALMAVPMANAQTVVRCSQAQKSCLLQSDILSIVKQLAPDLQNWTFVSVTDDMSWNAVCSNERLCEVGGFTNLLQRRTYLHTNKLSMPLRQLVAHELGHILMNSPNETTAAREAGRLLSQHRE